MSKLDLYIKEVAKKYGENTSGYGIVQEEYDKIPFSSPRLNYMTFGGLPTGRIYEFSGPEGSGKTTTALDVIKNAQKKFKAEAEKTGEPEKLIYFVDEEGTFDKVWANKFGVDVSKIVFFRPQGETAEEVLDVLRGAIETGEVGLAVLDSVATLVSGQIYDDSLEKKSYAGIAATLTRFVNVIKGPLLKYNCTLIMINQVRDIIGSLYGGTTTPGGRAFKHACSGRFEFRKGKFIDKDGNELSNSAENPAGNIIHMVVIKTKVFEPTRRVGFYCINYLNGPDVFMDYIEVGKQLGVISQRGAYYDIVNTSTGEILNKQKIQGKSALKQALEENESWRNLIDNTMSGKSVEEVTSEEILAEANKIVNTKVEE